ncbi:hypothetical protein NL676_013686 [Syzygium grande]|nr:hypothetical protein NL676_013686 [Syzygium grande]
MEVDRRMDLEVLLPEVVWVIVEGDVGLGSNKGIVGAGVGEDGVALGEEGGWHHGIRCGGAACGGGDWVVAERDGEGEGETEGESEWRRRRDRERERERQREREWRRSRGMWEVNRSSIWLLKNRIASPVQFQDRVTSHMPDR